MAAGRSSKALVVRRRRADEEGEDEEGSVMVGDSQSEGSLLSEIEDDDDEADGISAEEPLQESADAPSSQGRLDAAADKGRAAGKKPRKARKKGPKKQSQEQGMDASQGQNSGFKAMADTDAMMNGLRIDDKQTQEPVDFDSVQPNGSARLLETAQASAGANGNGHAEPSKERPGREHDGPRRGRDTNPAFIPSRGNFFMHDTRMQNGQGGTLMRGAWSGRGRGRGAANLSSSLPPSDQAGQADSAAEQPWKHDLHEAINEEPASLGAQKAMDSARHHQEASRGVSSSGPTWQSPAARVLSFSTTTKVGTVQIRVLIHGMKAPITFSEVPWKQYTRLPDHRPPLRRDKPVRISLPQRVPRYIFPSSERSFIFIPRQMRPNQQGFGRYSHQQRSIGGYGYSSRRTSMYGGSAYAASVAASRRSSFASVARENAFSPVAGSVQSARPIVRLPHGQQHQYSSPSTSAGPVPGPQVPSGVQIHTFSLPQQPTYQGTPTTMVHQPRPQKAISVTGIESPAILQQTPSAQEAQPFQNQLPAHLHEQTAYMQSQAYQSPSQVYAYPPQPAAGTPLSGIPEQAVHASTFQPPAMPYGQVPYYPAYPQQGYYYPPAPNGYQPLPMYMPPPPGYLMSPPAPLAPPQMHAPLSQPSSQPVDGDPQPQASQPPLQSQSQLQPQSQSRHRPAQSQSGMVAHESNGMVFYLPASEAQQQPHGETYQPAESFVPSYAMPGLPPPTPAPDAAYYYPSQMAMPGMSSAMYYPPQSQQ